LAPAGVKARTRSMKERRGRRGAGAASRGGERRNVVYGWHSAVAALENPRRRVTRILATRNALSRLAERGLGDLPQPVEARDIERLVGGNAVHQGIAIVCDPLREPALADLKEARLVVVLDQVTDPHNVGAVIRSAAAFGAAAVVLTERHGPAESGLLAKAASGGLEHVALLHVKNLARALDALGDLGFRRLGLDSAHAEPLEPAPTDGGTAIVLGAEGKGLRRLTREKCDRLVRLDVPGPITSLNVSNAAAVALYIVTRARAPA
jgi:23S rRNA (guanosine2251-2'-O)-methyltransferase